MSTPSWLWRSEAPTGTSFLAFLAFLAMLRRLPALLTRAPRLGRQAATTS